MWNNTVITWVDFKMNKGFIVWMGGGGWSSTIKNSDIKQALGRIWRNMKKWWEISDITFFSTQWNWETFLEKVLSINSKWEWYQFF